MSTLLSPSTRSLFRVASLVLLLLLGVSQILSAHPSTARAEETGTAGLKAEYYDRKDLTQPKVTRTDPTVNFDWRDGSPDSSIRAWTFSARWTGWVKADYGEMYTFYTHASHLRPRTYATTAANLNLRSGPSTSHRVLDVIPEGARVYVRKGPRNGHWYRVKYGHRIGYSHGYYLTQASSPTTPMPSPTPSPTPTDPPVPPSTPSPPPNTTSYFRTLPPGAALPTDAECAARVRRHRWEPRPANVAVNRTHPPSTYKVNGYGGMEHPELTWARVNGQANGTTDELIQHYACKWGLDEDVVRAQAVTESTWYQNLKDASGNPVAGNGYGDYGHCSGGPYGSSGPASLGIMQIKWCAHPGTLPYSETSTAFNLDYYGAVIRGCLNGWDYVTDTTGDLWGCVGRWYSGEWYRNNDGYIVAVKKHLAEKPWVSWGYPGGSGT